jgi:hypothetical protein
MSYQIRKSDGSLLVDLADGVTDRSKTSLSLVGKNVSSFGKDQNENFIKLLENFSSISQPPNALKGQLWFNTTADQIYVKTSTGFTSIGPFPDATTASVDSNTTDLATTAFVHSVVPKGIILMWSGSIANIPNGWALCDGALHNGVSTPDLRNRFVLGAGATLFGSVEVNDVGGRQAISEVPAHQHSYSATTDSNSSNHTHSGVTSSGGTHSHVFPGDDQLSFANGQGGWIADSVASFGYDARSVTGGGGQLWKTTSAGQHNHTFTTGNQSTSHNHNIDGDTAVTGVSSVNILNPYWALAYIIKVI